ncbi:SpvB/TcaC N-terminal domain-containing protein [Paenibacillus sp. MMS18-CY102]|uniref:SpvB/TcaC N-terminal domain-containing protein n=1 Tax=Paenibacillus sp. MMS18-CY102 TaxID=2682849 RepID=UPI001365661C|nr:SpvB/TcaC N-terminal domain-containing protein [Paenibacillus sp. MMS18-CY102]MWC30544.1 hypothetical protein [Paenibacillus sp. MMS18-CY102]
MTDEAGMLMSLPEGGGGFEGLSGDFHDNEFAGEASFHVPVFTSPCCEFEPQLALNYRSGGSNGSFGLGFKLSIPSISRKTAQGIPRYGESDTYLIDGEEDLVPLADANPVQREVDGSAYTVTAYRPRVDHTFERIERWCGTGQGDVHWRVTSRDNITSLYGTSPLSRICDPADESRIFRWLLAESFDAKGNRAIYEYEADQAYGLPDSLSDINRTTSANKYMQRIRYGNAVPYQEGQAAANSDSWHFEVLFDYGDFALPDHGTENCNPYERLSAIPAAAYRIDAFSSYYAGFEIRHRRLCRNILMFHRFEAELGVNPILVHATRLLYRETPAISLLASVESIGYRFESGAYKSDSLPPLEFFYSTFEPGNGQYSLLVDEHDNPVPGLSFSNGWQLADLYGAGVPGLLYHDGATMLYRQLRPSGEGEPDYDGGKLRFAQADPLVLVPNAIHQERSRLELSDLNGNGRLDWIVQEPGQYGYYESNPDRTWSPYRPMASVPAVLGDQEAYYSVDATGSGRNDWLLIEDGRVIVYPSLGNEGFGPPIISEQTGLPAPRRGSSNEWLDFAEMAGTGLKQLVRITNGRVECWPNLGYGSFGEPVALAGAPYFDEDLDATRLFLADLNGTGLADLIYVHPDRVDLYLNQSGNCFAEAISIPLPASWDRLSQLSFADVNGSGTACMLFSEEVGAPKHWCCDFNRGHKPYLLNRVLNNVGSETRISYCSSTKFYLADANKGVPWIETLPFPIQVVEKVEVRDYVSGTREFSQYAYHHGFYDGLEREFRGFGMVERWDAETVMADVQPTDVPPVWTKTWYHTGSWELAGPLSKQYAAEYYSECCGMDRLPDSVFDIEAYRTRYPNWMLDSEAEREANRAFKGLVLRQEIFAPAAAASPGQMQDAPYRVTEWNYEARLIQPPLNDRFGIYTVHQRETLNADYERMPADPHVTHELALEVDGFGNVLHSCTVAYGRDPATAGCIPEQCMPVIQLERHRYANQADDEVYLAGVLIESLTFEIRNLQLPEGRKRLSFEEAALRLTNVTDVPGTPLIGGLRHYYWSSEQGAAMPLGKVSPQALHYSTETLYYAMDMLSDGFGAAMAVDQLVQLLETEGGYRQEAGYWWGSGHASEYGSLESFYLVQASADCFGARTSYKHDTYGLLIAGVTDALNNTAAMEGDYLCLLPQRITDRNQNVSEVLYDGLGRVRVASRYGAESGKEAGFMPLGHYQVREKAMLDAIVQDPAAYLQGAAHFYQYDLLSWMGQVSQVDLVGIGIDTAALWQELMANGNISYSGGITQRFREMRSAEQLLLSEAFGLHRNLIYDTLAHAPQGKPTRAVSLDAVQYVHNAQDAESDGPAAVRIEITFRDGLGRLVQLKQLVEPGEAFIVADPLKPPSAEEDIPVGQANPRWLATGRTVYNNKGQPVKQYEPYFINAAEFADCKNLHRFGSSPTFEYDPLGRECRIISAKGFVRRIDRAPWEETDWDGIDTLLESPYYMANISGSDPASPYYDPDLADEDRQTMAKSALLAGTPEHKRFNAQGKTVQMVTYKDSQHTLITKHEWDSSGNLLTSADPRLGAMGLENFRYAYNFANQRYRTASVDGGSSRWIIWNANGDPIFSRHGLYTKRFFYDELHRLTSVQVIGPDGQARIVEALVYGESLELQQATAANLRGELYQRFGQSGLMAIEAYSIDAHPKRVTHRFAQEYVNLLDWSPAGIANPEKLLEKQTFEETFGYDAVGQLVTHADALGNRADWQYGLAGWLLRAELLGSDEPSPQAAFQITDCNAKGQWLQLAYGTGDGWATTYEYDARTFEPTRVRTQQAGKMELQDLQLFHDPLGHISQTIERALPFSLIVRWCLTTPTIHLIG